MYVVKPSQNCAKTTMVRPETTTAFLVKAAKNS